MACAGECALLADVARHLRISLPCITVRVCSSCSCCPCTCLALACDGGEWPWVQARHLTLASQSADCGRRASPVSRGRGPGHRGGGGPRYGAREAGRCGSCGAIGIGGPASACPCLAGAAAAGMARRAGQRLTLTQDVAARRALAAAPLASSASQRLLDEFEVRCSWWYTVPEACARDPASRALPDGMQTSYRSWPRRAAGCAPTRPSMSTQHERGDKRSMRIYRV